MLICTKKIRRQDGDSGPPFVCSLEYSALLERTDTLTYYLEDAALLERTDTLIYYLAHWPWRAALLKMHTTPLRYHNQAGHDKACWLSLSPQDQMPHLSLWPTLHLQGHVGSPRTHSHHPAWPTLWSYQHPLTLPNSRNNLRIRNLWIPWAQIILFKKIAEYPRAQNNH